MEILTFCEHPAKDVCRIKIQPKFENDLISNDLSWKLTFPSFCIIFIRQIVFRCLISNYIRFSLNSFVKINPPSKVVDNKQQHHPNSHGRRAHIVLSSQSRAKRPAKNGASLRHKLYIMSQRRSRRKLHNRAKMLMKSPELP